MTGKIGRRYANRANTLWYTRSAPEILPTEVDIAWAAGLFEGEGYCCIYGNATTKATIGMTDKEPIEKICKMFGGRYHTQSRKPPMKPFYYIWNISGRRGREFLQTIYEHLSPRRKQQILDAHGIYREPIITLGDAVETKNA